MSDATSVSRPIGGWWAIGVVAVICTVLQVSSGMLRMGMEGEGALATPNTATHLAETLAATGKYEGPGANRLWGPDSPKAKQPLHAFLVPGEVWYQAMWLVYAPHPIQRFAHLPITVGLILSIAMVALFIGGPRLALVAGLVGSFYPFILIHGPVFDDTFMAAALDWWVMVILLGAARTGARGISSRRCIALAVIAILTAYAVLTRSQSALVLCGVAVIILLHPSLRFMRPYGLVLILSTVAALGAWGWRNYNVLGHFLAGSTHDGVTLWEAVEPGAGEAMAEGGTVEGGALIRMRDDFAKTQSLDEWGANSYFTARAKAYILSHPGAVTRLGLAKVAVSMTGYNAGTPLRRPHNLVALASGLLLLIFGLYGLWQTRRLETLHGPMSIIWYTVMLLISMLTFAILFIGSAGYRYRIEIDGFLMIGLALMIVRLMPQKGTGLRPAPDGLRDRSVGQR